MDNVVRSFFTEVLNNTALQSQLDPIWSRYEDSESPAAAQESLSQVINLAGMHGFKFSSVELDDVIQESMANDFLEVQSGEVELSDADLDLVAAGKFGGKPPKKSKTKKRPNRNCRDLRSTNLREYRRYCK